MKLAYHISLHFLLIHEVAFPVSLNFFVATVHESGLSNYHTNLFFFVFLSKLSYSANRSDSTVELAPVLIAKKVFFVIVHMYEYLARL